MAMRWSGRKLVLAIGGSMISFTIFLCLLNSISFSCHCEEKEVREVLCCSDSRPIKKQQGEGELPQPTIYVITPTYKRMEQIPELTRLAQTLMHVPNLHWIVGDDTSEPNRHIVEYLSQTGIPHTYLLTPMPKQYRTRSKALPKGVANRNAGLKWLRKHATQGVVYFADDDNTYDIRIFEEIRRTKRVSAFPVGLVTSYGLSTPVVKNGSFFDWYDGWRGGRKFPVDMAGFAFSVPYLLQKPKAIMPYKAGFEEDGFLRSLQIDPKEVEFLADGCTKIYVWHTKTRPNKPSKKTILNTKYDGTNLRQLQKDMILEM
ncbi:galactosylgalactosylxylosylprotein 3-beta-glucuronosyltransferase P-like isoform X2 [Palaemon carinicauda]|uniref:galactosylgalactosylxylosylprotein 3-beta-glucuronosyltransferase P-like isoform X2 n=1 Tax=Palaemon carinicauda TaxID=392227 RepID=UPI0035B573DF